MILPAAYIPSSVILDKIAKFFNKKYVIILAMFASCASLVLVGPSTLLGSSIPIMPVMITG